MTLISPAFVFIITGTALRTVLETGRFSGFSQDGDLVAVTLHRGAASSRTGGVEELRHRWKKRGGRRVADVQEGNVIYVRNKGDLNGRGCNFFLNLILLTESMRIFAPGVGLFGAHWSKMSLTWYLCPLSRQKG